MREISINFFGIVILALAIYLKYFDEYWKHEINNSDSFNAIISFFTFFLLFNIAAKIIKTIYLKSYQKSHIKNDNFLNAIDNIRKIIIGIAAFVHFFAFFGINVQKLFTSLSIFAAAIAIISKEFVNDLLVGIYYSFSKDFEINDYVKVCEQKGKILEIGLLKIKILNDDDDTVFLSNGKVYTSEIVNYTKRDIRLMSIDFQVHIDYVKNIEALESELINTLYTFSEYIEADTYNLKIVEMKKDYLDLKFQYTLQEMNRDLQRQIRRKTVREIFKYITSKRNNVTNN